MSDEQQTAQQELSLKNILANTKSDTKNDENFSIPLASVMDELLERSYQIYLNNEDTNVYLTLQTAIQQASAISHYRGVIEGKQIKEEAQKNVE